MVSQLLKSSRRHIIKPLGIAILVGMSVHAIITTVGFLACGFMYFSAFLTTFETSMYLGVVTIIAPFIPPFFIAIYAQREISRAQEYQFMEKAIPGMAIGKHNPASGMVSTVKINRSLSYIFGEDQENLENSEFFPERFWAQPDGRTQYLKKLLEEKQIKNLPVEIKRLDGDNRWGMLHSVLRPDNMIQATIIDTTREKQLENQIQHAYTNTLKLIEGIEQVLTNFNSIEFTVEEAYKTLFRDLLIIGECRPSHIFSTSVEEEGALLGHVYFAENNTVVKSPDHIRIRPKTRVAITRGKGAVYWSNGPEPGETEKEYENNFNPEVLKIVKKVRNYTTYTTGRIAIIAFNYCREVSRTDAEVLHALAVITNTLKTIADQAVETEQAFIYAMEALARACESHDEDTASHLRRVNEYSKAIAIELGESERFISTIYYSAQMHDVGKINVPLEILLKPGHLTEEEFRIIRRHPKGGADILGDNPRVVMARNIAFTHHEQFGGGGYPWRLDGEQIPLEGRIVTLADVYDALRSKRSYKPAFTHKKALRTFREGDSRLNPGEHFDPQVIKAFFTIEKKIDDIYNTHSE